jgi:hypothetical protein
MAYEYPITNTHEDAINWINPDAEVHFSALPCE